MSTEFAIVGRFAPLTDETITKYQLEALTKERAAHVNAFLGAHAELPQKELALRIEALLWQDNGTFEEVNRSNYSEATQKRLNAYFSGCLESSSSVIRAEVRAITVEDKGRGLTKVDDVATVTLRSEGKEEEGADVNPVDVRSGKKDTSVELAAQKWQKKEEKVRRQLDAALASGREDRSLKRIYDVLDSANVRAGNFYGTLRAWAIVEFCSGFVSDSGSIRVDMAFIEAFASFVSGLFDGKLVPKPLTKILTPYHRGCAAAIKRCNSVKDHRFATVLVFNETFHALFPKAFPEEFLEITQKFFDLVIDMCRIHISERASKSNRAILEGFELMEKRKGKKEKIDPHALLMTGVELRAVTTQFAQNGSKSMESISYAVGLYCQTLQYHLDHRIVAVPEGKELPYVETSVTLPASWVEAKGPSATCGAGVAAAAGTSELSSNDDVQALIELSETFSKKTRVDQCLGYQLRVLASHVLNYKNTKIRAVMTPHLVFNLSNILRLVFQKLSTKPSVQLDLVALAKDAGVWDRVEQELLTTLRDSGFTAGAGAVGVAIAEENGKELSPYLKMMGNNEWGAKQTYDAINKTLKIVADLLESTRVEVKGVKIEDSGVFPTMPHLQRLVLPAASIKMTTSALAMRTQVINLKLFVDVFASGTIDIQVLPSLVQAIRSTLNQFCSNATRMALFLASHNMTPPIGVSYNPIYQDILKWRRELKECASMTRPELFDFDPHLVKGKDFSHLPALVDIAMRYLNPIGAGETLTTQHQKVDFNRIKKAIDSLLRAVNEAIRCYDGIKIKQS